MIIYSKDFPSIISPSQIYKMLQHLNKPCGVSGRTLMPPPPLFGSVRKFISILRDILQ